MVTPRNLLLGCGVLLVAVVICAAGIFIAPFVHISIGGQTTGVSTGDTPTVAPGTGGNTPGTNPTPIPTTPPTGQGCVGGKNFQLGSSLSDSNVYYRVEFNTNGTWPEYESWLSPGTYNITSGVGGWVWEFPTSCTTAQLQADANSSHNRRTSQPGFSGSVLEPNNPIVTSAFTK
jgi:hypothetical protein